MNDYAKNTAVVLLSGGQDSTTCLFWAIKKFETVHAIGFDYGQSHRIELKQAMNIAEDNYIPYDIINLKGIFSRSSLVDNSDHNAKSSINSELPASFTAGRNLVFLTVAGSFAAMVGAGNIVSGVCQTDFNGFPDCRRTTIDAQQLALSLGLGFGDLKIHTPLMYLSKAETWKLAKELDCIEVIINDTITDYNGNMTKNEWGMGDKNNPSTKLRMEGYYEAKQKGWI